MHKFDTELLKLLAELKEQIRLLQESVNAL
jgi:hypothetical protein